ncbi:MAG: esterase-like activity of phytase family protein [Hyphomicrobium sp.]|nr:esterase-like activity of phytase family protein [Hyphomicrobium sp.]
MSSGTARSSEQEKHAGPTHFGRRLFAGGAILALTCGLAFAAIKPSPKGLKGERLDVTSIPITVFERAGRPTTDLGRLSWRGGLVLTDPSPHFGGWSGLVISPDGRRLTAISDAGAWMAGTLVYGRNRHPDALTDVTIGALKAKSGKDLARGRDRDAEGMTLASGTLDNGEVLISFENHHRIGRFPVQAGIPGAPSSYLELPAELRKKDGRDGLETVVALRSGAKGSSILAISEYAADEAETHAAWLWRGGKPEKLSIRAHDDYAITDAVGLDNGNIILLERRFRVLDGVRMRLREIAAGDIAPGAILDGEVLVDADLTREIDNMEGLAVHRESDGTTILTLISDDNFSRILQRTILLQFALRPRASG